MEKEYRGQKVLAAYDARMIPPNDSYPDCECRIVLTKQHLYVLEDNYDGTHETHFEFVMGEIDDIEIEQEQTDIYSDKQTVSVSSQVITAVFSLLAGAISTSGRNQKIKKEFLVIRYHDMRGEKGSLYFNRGGSGAGDFIKAFRKAKQQ